MTRLDSKWDLIARSATVPKLKPSGGAWDASGGLPDPKLCITVKALGQTKCTRVVRDTLTPTWDARLVTSTPLSSTSIIEFEFFDDDEGKRDAICAGWGARPLPTAPMGNLWTFLCKGGEVEDGAVNFEIVRPGQ